MQLHQTGHSSIVPHFGKSKVCSADKIAAGCTLTNLTAPSDG
jgi:hypothetical protein